MNRLKNFINGEFCAPASEHYLDNYNPATGEVQSQIPDSNELDVVRAIQSANKAFPEWSSLPVKERAKFLNLIANGIEHRADEFALAESKDTGKPLWLAKELDIPRAVTNFRFFASRILHKQESSTDMDGKALNYVLRQPVGVAGLISPWNLPVYLLTWKIAPCLAVGNTAVCKPSELTSTTAYLLAEVMREVKLPEGVCNIIFGRGEVAGSMLVQHPSVPLISFTGGTVTGEKIQNMASPHFKKLSLELGGKNANIVFKDADLKRAVAGSVRAAFLNQGEICLAGSRLLVQQDIYEEFMQEFRQQVKALKVGDPENADTFMGPVISQAHLQKIQSAIALAKKENGKVTVGGEVPELDSKFKKGYFIQPTVIEDLTMCSELWQQEIFGPVVLATSFKYPPDAVKWANTSPYGLSASVWTKDLTKAHKVAADIKAGTVWVNTWLHRDLRMPFGGTKASGLGREGGDYSFDFFTDTKTVCVQF